MDFGKRLKESRIKRGLSQEELAYQINQKINGSIRRNTISNYENNVSRPDYDTLRALAEILTTSTDTLLHIETGHFKSIVEEDEAMYNSSKVLAEAEKKMADISAAMASAEDKDRLNELLNESITLNQQLVEHYRKLYAKNKQALDFINKGLNIE